MVSDREVKGVGGHPVWIGHGLLAHVGELIGEKKAPCRAILVADQTTEALFGHRVKESLEKSGFSTVSMCIEPGEGSKSLSSLGRLLEFMAESDLDRFDLLVALGGGVVGDLAGFAAAVYCRGIDYVQLPTTFLAAIDSSVGGKTAINLAAGKNLAGAFHQPLAVICDCDTFSTLSREHFADGAAEAVKYGVLAGGTLFSLLLAGCNGKPGLPQSLWVDAVEHCVRLKTKIIGGDAFDRGQRQLLNLGHTIGHSIEKCSGFEESHGRAVAAGLAIIARGAEKTGFADAGCSGQICEALRVQGLPTQTQWSVQALYEGALYDKKREGDHMQLILPRRIGDCQRKQVELAELKELIALGLEE